MNCSICGEELIPENDKVVQVREGYLQFVGGVEEFIPRQDREYCHSGCYDGCMDSVTFPSKKEV